MSAAAFPADAFAFSTTGTAPNVFRVMEFEGTEGISEPYRFELRLASPDDALNPMDFLDTEAAFTLRPSNLYNSNMLPVAADEIPIHGQITEFESLQQLRGGMTSYRAVLEPRLGSLRLNRQSQVYLDASTPDILRAELERTGFSLDRDCSFLLSPVSAGDGFGVLGTDEKGFLRKELLCQYQETDLDLIHRLMEREGIYYYFDHGADGSRMVLTNDRVQHPSADPDSVQYQPDAPLLDTPSVRALGLTRRPSVKSIRLRDYNYRKPSLTIDASEAVDENGMGELYCYGDHFWTPEEGRFLAEIRKEALLCEYAAIRGTGTAAFLRAGFNVRIQARGGLVLPQLTDSLAQADSLQVQIVRLRHRGRQSFVDGGAGSSGEGRPEYENTFEAIPAEMQYRSPPRTPRPRVPGVLSGWIDLEEIDDQGRYKVRLPFDLADRQSGKSSCWVRLATPYAGADRGQHYPLRKDQEVLLSFTDNDPDRPLIVAAVMNDNSPTQTSDARHSVERVATGSSFTSYAAGPSDDSTEGDAPPPPVDGFAGDADSTVAAGHGATAFDSADAEESEGGGVFSGFSSGSNTGVYDSDDEGLYTGDGYTYESGDPRLDDSDSYTGTTSPSAPDTGTSVAITPQIVHGTTVDSSWVYKGKHTVTNSSTYLEDNQDNVYEQIFGSLSESGTATTWSDEHLGDTTRQIETTGFDDTIRASALAITFQGKNGSGNNMSSFNRTWTGNVTLNHYGDQTITRYGDWSRSSANTCQETYTGNVNRTVRNDCLESMEGHSHQEKEAETKTVNDETYKESSGLVLDLFAGAKYTRTKTKQLKATFGMAVSIYSILYVSLEAAVTMDYVLLNLEIYGNESKLTLFVLEQVGFAAKSEPFTLKKKTGWLQQKLARLERLFQAIDISPAAAALIAIIGAFVGAAAIIILEILDDTEVI